MLALLFSILWLGPVICKEFTQISTTSLSICYSTMVDATGTFFATGDTSKGKGNIYRSRDLGMTWDLVLQATSTVYDIVSGTFEGITYYIAVDNFASTHVSTTGGDTWTTITRGVTTIYYSVALGSNGMAYELGNSEIRVANHTTSYTKWVIPKAIGNYFWADVSTMDGVNVIVVGSGGNILYSTNSFAAVTLLSSTSTQTSNQLNGVAHYSNFEAVVTGNNGYVAKTTNGGATWTKLTSLSTSYSMWYHNIHIVSPTEGYIAVFNNSAGRIYRTTDYSTWTVFMSPPIVSYSIFFYGSQHGVIGGSGVVPILAMLPGNSTHNFCHSENANKIAG